MSDRSHINLKDYSPDELKSAIASERKIDKFRKKPAWEQFFIVARQNGLSLTAIIVLLTGGVWQKDSILQILNPPTETINEQIITHNLPSEVELNSRRIEKLEVKIKALSSFVKKSHLRRK
jgi:hypothetical protein